MTRRWGCLSRRCSAPCFRASHCQWVAVQSQLPQRQTPRQRRVRWRVEVEERPGNGDSRGGGASADSDEAAAAAKQKAAEQQAKVSLW